MKKRICFVLILCISLFVFSPVHAQQRKSVAVVLSGGGAKGVAHIGALKVIEEAGIPIDYIVGTSMGSIIGGLYSIGYTPHQLDSMVNHQNWPLLLSDRISWEDQTMTERPLCSFKEESEGQCVRRRYQRPESGQSFFGTDSRLSRLHQLQ